MSTLWGNMSGPEIVKMGMDIFNMARQQALQQQAIQQERERLAKEDIFRKQQLDMQQQRIAFEGQRLKQQEEIGLQNIQTSKARSEYFKTQRDEALQVKQKLNEYSMKLGEMLETLDFSNADDMKKLYTFQTQYAPYGISAQYIKPVTAGPGIKQGEYGKFISNLYAKLINTAENEYNQAMKKYLQDLKAWESGGFWGMGKGPKPTEPEFALPDVNQVKDLANQMLQEGIKIEDLIKPQMGKIKEEEAEPISRGSVLPKKQSVDMRRLGTQYIPLSDMSIVDKANLATQPFVEMFNPSMKEYNRLSPAERRVVDRYMEDAGVNLEDAISSIKEARARRMQ